MNRSDQNPTAYLNSIEEPRLRAAVDRLRRLILQVDPETHEGIANGMLDYPGLASLAAQKNYAALYTDVAVIADFADRLEGIDCGKSCLRFRSAEAIPEATLRDLLREVRSRNGG